MWFFTHQASRLLYNIVLLLVHVLEHLGFIDYDPDGVNDMALVAAEVAQGVGKVLVEHLYVVNEIVGLAAVAEYVLESPHLVVFEFDLPALDLSLIEQLHERVLVVAVVVK